MKQLLLRLLINAFALWLAAHIISGIRMKGGIFGLLVVALVFGLVNAIIKPIIKFFSFGFILITLGLFTLVINALMLWLTAGLTDALEVNGFVPAFLGSLLISVVSVV